MSLFRRPGEDSSSDDSSDTQEEEELEEDHTSLSTEDLNLLSRINTIDSARPVRQTQLTARPTVSRSNSHVRDLMLHALLEEKALRVAAEHLGKESSDPEVQNLARETFSMLSRQLSSSTDETYASDDMRIHRAAAQEGIDAITRRHITTIAAAPDNSQYRAVMPRSIPSRTVSNINGPFPSIATFTQVPLQGFTGLHTDRYVREFIELDVVGKGGYGKVYKVKHKLDNSLYAVKRIMVSSARLQKIQDNGPQEMECLLDEVRALAKFDHGNIVRYHNCWLEYTTAPKDVPLPPSTLRANRLLEEGSRHGKGDYDIELGIGNLSFGGPSHDIDAESGACIVFENSEPSTGGMETHSELGSKSYTEILEAPRHRARRGSQATVATMSSTRSRVSTIKSVGENDEEVENIIRSHPPEFQDLTSEVSESMLSHSDIQNQLTAKCATGPVLTLNVQMSLYDTNLAAFLSPERTSFSNDAQLHHCFHPCISLELLRSILSGVEYLHAQGVVHRDLKPANVFLSLSTSKMPPSGSINLAGCLPCPARECLHITPRIGDFGLVAALGDGCLTSDTVAKPVGTEFYRPEGGERVGVKLDIFALGVVAFELLCQFSTRMERVDALTRLRRGELPSRNSFADDSPCGVELQNLLAGMVHPDETKRSSCDGVKAEVHELVRLFKEKESEVAVGH